MEMHSQSLPIEFVERMKEMLGEEYEAFAQSYECERSYGLRRNPLKCGAEEFEQSMPFGLSKVPWAEEGYFCEREEQPGKHILHEAGAYYIQEPSAMSVADYLGARPGERICDLCAAPGGKTTQLAGKMMGDGLLVSNEIIPQRARILAQNLERLGITNAVVLNEDTDRLKEAFPFFFDRILADAPCSGEGMFRKDEDARLEWSPAQVASCAKRQQMILRNADAMLRPGGTLVYSTCTFSPEENEATIAQFLYEHPEYELCEIPLYDGMEKGRPDWAMRFGELPDQITEKELTGMHLERTIRLWPHKLSGEGHFVACLKKKEKHSEEIAKEEKTKEKRKEKKPNNTNGSKLKEGIKLWQEFETSTLTQSVCGRMELFGDYLYCIPEGMISFDGLKVELAGLCLGELKKNRFEPSHALALSLKPGQIRQCLELSMEQANAYISGETISAPAQSGWMVLSYKGFILGWGKASSGQIKNHYPKGKRKNNQVK